MKKIIAILTVSLVTINSWCQTEKGNFLIGASSNINFSSIKTESEISQISSETNQFNLTAGSGYFIVDNLAIGLGIGYSNSNTDNSRNRITLFSPFVKYYFLEGKTKLFTRASFGFGSNKNETNIITTLGPSQIESESDVSNFEIGAGAAFFINDFLSIELGVSYLNQKLDAIDISNPSPIELTQTGVFSSVGFILFL